MKLKWINTEGGPLIMLAENLLPSWQGTGDDALIDDTHITKNLGVGRRKPILSERKLDRILKEKPVSDYDRACKINDFIAPISVGRGSGIVLGAEPTIASIHSDKTDRGEIVIVASFTLPDDGEVEWLVRNSDQMVTTKFTEYHCTSPKHVLFDSAYDGPGIEESLSFDLISSSYIIETGLHKFPKADYLVYHRFVPGH